jgi:hypothetical protein
VEALAVCYTPVDYRKELGAEGCNIAVYILNGTGHTPVKIKTPFEPLAGSYATVGHLRVLGKKCYLHTPKQRRGKWNRRVLWVDWSDTLVKERLSNLDVLRTEDFAGS